MGSRTYVGMIDRDKSICPGSIQLWRGPTGDRYRAQSMRHDHLGTYLTREAAEAAIREYHRRHGPTERDATAALVDRLCAMIPEPDRRAMWREDDDPIADFFVSRRLTLTLYEIGRLYGLTKERIRQVQEVALRKALLVAKALEIESPADRPDLWDTIETYHG